MQKSWSQSMRAALTASAGAAQVLTTVAVPEPGPGEVLVRVMASSVNPSDVMAWKRGAFVTGQVAPFVGGYDLAGVVVALGRGVTVLNVGDAVAGMPRFPVPAATFAEYTVIPTRHVARLPAVATHLAPADWSRWAALPLAGLTAWQALLDTAAVKPGQKVLIQAASGGVGHLAVQLAATMGADVTAITSERGRILVERLPTSRIIDRAVANWGALQGNFDVVLDAVGGGTTELSLALATPIGVVVALHPFAHDSLAAREPRLRRMLVEPDHHALKQLITLQASTQLAVHVGATYPLHDLDLALRQVETNQTLGKTTIDNQGDLR